MLSGNVCCSIFQKSVETYHIKDDVNAPSLNSYPPESFQFLLYQKNWIDSVQWHFEDIIRNPDINPVEGIAVKRKIDSLNQTRTDAVEKIDDYFLSLFSKVKTEPHARLNSETPAWLLDRMSILILKIYHMNEQVMRTDVSQKHIENCRAKLNVLLEQKADMEICFDELMSDLQSGIKKMKVYRQMKMYNDESLNPVLYASKK